jgi:hypothetical protein
VQARLCSDALQALRVEQEWAANQVYFEEYRQKEEKRTQEEVRPDFAVCCAIVTVRRDYLAASQKLRREQERDAAWAASRPDCAGVPSSDALQEARRAERTQLQEQERKKERDDRNVRPDCVLCFARRD